MKSMQLFLVHFNLFIFETPTGRLTILDRMVAGIPVVQSVPYKDTTEKMKKT
jgi:hypothetical protein